MPIMKKAYSLKIFTSNEMQAINRVRLALQLVFLSELVVNQSLQIASEYKGSLVRKHSLKSSS